MSAEFPTSRVIAPDVARALGLNPDLLTQLSIHFEPDRPVVVRAEFLADADTCVSLRDMLHKVGKTYELVERKP